mmetsp:Transcript_95396/g.284825  ORF Transcript_95396/g.284825 Transcript_95396/m.284825 type:complete len:207 (-) Transcript_95396:208-828(-)
MGRASAAATLETAASSPRVLRRSRGRRGGDAGTSTGHLCVQLRRRADLRRQLRGRRSEDGERLRQPCGTVSSGPAPLRHAAGKGGDDSPRKRPQGRKPPSALCSRGPEDRLGAAGRAGGVPQVGAPLRIPRRAGPLVERLPLLPHPLHLLAPEGVLLGGGGLVPGVRRPVGSLVRGLRTRSAVGRPLVRHPVGSLIHSLRGWSAVG